ncbi:MAG: hypothetical protein HYZ34_10075 [Ignavibacteriae bacterium]|nr:hypothetical protein [Ignavibacteriota bacterium]
MFMELKYDIHSVYCRWESATLSLHYDDTELPEGVAEDSLHLLRLDGTTVSRTVSER